MSTRVFNPVVMELRRAMRGGGAAADFLDAAATPAEVTFQAPARVRRNLFGPVDHEETRLFVERELAAISRRDEELYEFDFAREQPREGPTRRFAWERVTPGAVHESYALRRLAFLGAAAATVAVAATSAAAGEAPAPAHDAAQAMAAAAAAEAAADPAEAASTPTPAQPPCTPAPPPRTRQTQISDFLRSRKRPSSSTASKSAPSSSKADVPTPAKLRKSSSSSTAAATAS